VHCEEDVRSVAVVRLDGLLRREGQPMRLAREPQAARASDRRQVRVVRQLEAPPRECGVIIPVSVSRVAATTAHAAAGGWCGTTGPATLVLADRGGPEAAGAASCYGLW
jgi:hypothetical protein